MFVFLFINVFVKRSICLLEYKRSRCILELGFNLQAKMEVPLLATCLLIVFILFLLSFYVSFKKNII